MTTTTTDTPVNLVRKLTQMEKVLNSLLQSPKTSNSLIKRKISDLEELMLKIPETDTTLTDEWIDKLAVLLKKAYSERSPHSGNEENGDLYGFKGSKELQQQQQPPPSELPGTSTESMHISNVKNSDAGVPIVETASKDELSEAAMEVDSYDQLIQDLTNLEVSIQELLAQRPVSLAKMQCKLTLLLGAIIRIPQSYPTLYNKWATQGADLMAKFAALAEPTKKTVEKEGSMVKKNGKPLSPTSECMGAGHQKEQPPKRQLIESKLREAFDRFSDYSVASDGPLREVFYLTAKAFKLTKPHHPSDTAFSARIFDLIFSKLHPSLAEQFYIDPKRAENKKLLIDLCTFLSRSLQEDQEPMGAGFERERCHFCNRQGHNAHNCARVINRLCYSCFEKGHDWKNCPNPTLTTKQLLNSL